MKNNLNIPMIIYISLVHLAATYGIACIPHCHINTLLWAFALWPISGLGITAGAHRLWAHRSYKATYSLRMFLMLCNSVANQGTIYHWSRDHRVHHKYAETDADPHNAKRGFWFSHMGWYVRAQMCGVMVHCCTVCCSCKAPSVTLTSRRNVNRSNSKVKGSYTDDCFCLTARAYLFVVAVLCCVFFCAFV